MYLSHRLLPNGTDNNISQDGMKYYRTLFEELLKANITPVVTLFHWDMPTPLMDLGGWANPKIVDYFEDYARVVFNLYGDIIKMWTTINEPHQQCYNVSNYSGLFNKGIITRRKIPHCDTSRAVWGFISKREHVRACLLVCICVT